MKATILSLLAVGVNGCTQEVEDYLSSLIMSDDAL